MFNAAIFDMDGVIANSHPIHLESWKQLLTQAGVPIPDYEGDIFRDGRSKEDLLRHFMGDITQDQLRIYADEKDRLYRERATKLTPVSGIGRFLNQLKSSGITLGVASSGSLWRVEHTLDLLQLGHYFRTVSTADEFTSGKSDSTIFVQTAYRMQARCEETLVFEDSATAIRSARAIGMKCVGIADSRRAKSLLEAGAERVSPNFVRMSLSSLQRLFTSSRDRRGSDRLISCSV